MTTLADLSMTEAADAVLSDETTSVALLEACWRRMEAVNPVLNATIWTDRESAMASAQSADAPVRVDTFNTSGSTRCIQ
jgi:Asp-tRNA(Asn)/Glu-tRNA(Gln) amidotransferase A subunit family amidase